MQPVSSATNLDAWLAQRYGRLLVSAKRVLRRRGEGLRLTPFDLVHDTYLRLSAQGQRLPGEDRELDRAAQRVMHEVVVDRVRRSSVRRTRPLEGTELGPEVELSQLLDLAAALRLLGDRRPRQCRIVLLRYFDGLSLEECAVRAGVSLATLKRELVLGRTWLGQQLAR